MNFSTLGDLVRRTAASRGVGPRVAAARVFAAFFVALHEAAPELAGAVRPVSFSAGILKTRAADPGAAELWKFCREPVRAALARVLGSDAVAEIR